MTPVREEASALVFVIAYAAYAIGLLLGFIIGRIGR